MKKFIFLMRWNFGITIIAKHFPLPGKVSSLFASPQGKNHEVSCLKSVWKFF